jgi:hypothetical protein
MKRYTNRKTTLRPGFGGLEWTIAFVLLSALSVTALVDFNTNGLDDVWENYYSATGLSVNGDADFDGVSNFDESVAGTDPLSEVSYLYPGFSVTPSNATYGWSALPGKVYQPQLNLNLISNSWSDIGSTISFGSHSNVQLTLPLSWENCRISTATVTR